MTTPQSSVPTARRSGNSGHFARGRGGGGTPSSGRWSAVAAAGSNGTGSGGHRSNSRGEPRGSFGKMSNRSDASHEQLVCLLAMLVGQMVVVTLQRGERYVGVLAAASTVLLPARRVALCQKTYRLTTSYWSWVCVDDRSRWPFHARLCKSDHMHRIERATAQAR